MIEQFFSLIAPHLCVACQKEGTLLCLDCSQKLPPMPLHCYRCGAQSDPSLICPACRPHTSLVAVRVATPYGASMRKLVHHLKYGRAAAAARPLANLIADRLLDLSSGPVVVTHAPTASGRIRVRGYDQSELIARTLARTLALPYRPTLVRLGQTRQVGASKEQRKIQMYGAFKLCGKALPPGAHIILVDDVLTTGSTLEAAAAVLKRAGVESVTAVVCTAAQKVGEVHPNLL